MNLSERQEILQNELINIAPWYRDEEICLMGVTALLGGRDPLFVRDHFFLWPNPRDRSPFRHCVMCFMGWSLSSLERGFCMQLSDVDVTPYEESDLSEGYKATRLEAWGHLEKLVALVRPDGRAEGYRWDAQRYRDALDECRASLGRHMAFVDEVQYPALDFCYRKVDVPGPTIRREVIGVQTHTPTAIWGEDGEGTVIWGEDGEGSKFGTKFGTMFVEQAAYVGALAEESLVEYKEMLNGGRTLDRSSFPEDSGESMMQMKRRIMELAEWEVYDWDPAIQGHNGVDYGLL